MRIFILSSSLHFILENIPPDLSFSISHEFLLTATPISTRYVSPYLIALILLVLTQFGLSLSITAHWLSTAGLHPHPTIHLVSILKLRSGSNHTYFCVLGLQVYYYISFPSPFLEMTKSSLSKTIRWSSYLQNLASTLISPIASKSPYLGRLPNLACLLVNNCTTDPLSLTSILPQLSLTEIDSSSVDFEVGFLELLAPASYNKHLATSPF